MNTPNETFKNARVILSLIWITGELNDHVRNNRC
jgi:hypothetical protein